MTTPTWTNPIVKWIDYRLPVFTFTQHHLIEYPTPKNLNYWWNFGSLAGIMLVILIATGIFLAMYYTPHVDYAFDSVERIMRDVNYGWLLRYLHMNGGSLFFVAVYIHMFRGLYYGSYKAPREILWMIGVLILFTMMATAFMGYVLPWGQMSFWAATVITSLFTAVPFIGEAIVNWLWGGFAVGNATLNRFFSLHYLLPFVIFALVFLHLWALHVHKSNNPVGVDVKGPQDTIPFHPYYTIKDSFGLGVLMLVYLAFVFFAPNFFLEPDNYIEANPLQTPPHIVPEWYLMPFYAILRAFTPGLPLDSGQGSRRHRHVRLDRHPFLPALARYLEGAQRPFPAHLQAGLLALFRRLLHPRLGGGQPARCPLHGDGVVAHHWATGHRLLLPPFPRRDAGSRNRGENPSGARQHQRRGDRGRRPGQGGDVMRGRVLGAALALALALATGAASAAEAPKPSAQDWSFDGIFGTYDWGALRRGVQIYNEVCASCHSLKLVAYRNLGDIGFGADEVKAIAADFEVTDGPNEDGDMFTRPARPADRFAAPFENVQAARAANNGALPPDLSVITKARKGGADYIYAILAGYLEEPPAGVELADGMSYNEYFPGQQIAMPSPLGEDAVAYADGTKATTAQMSKDVTTFLVWAAEPAMEERKRLGVKVMLFLIVLTALLYALKRKIWSDLH